MIDDYDGNEPVEDYIRRVLSTENVDGSENELHPRYLGGGANINPWAGNDSSSRSQMLGSHLAQTLVIDNPTPRRTITGVEFEYGKYTFKQIMPETGRIAAIFDKYTIGGKNPERLVVFEHTKVTEDGKTVFDIMPLTRVSSRHQLFGFTYVSTPEINNIRVNNIIEKGTVLQQSPSLDRNGSPRMGVSSNMAYMSLHGTTEDGVIARRKYLEQFNATGIESRVASWGNGVMPINIAGDKFNYRTHPGLGQRIPDHGIVMGTREYDVYLAIVNMSSRALRKPNVFFDDLVYGKPGAEVIDVTVWHDYNFDRGKQNRRTPFTMSEYDKRYYDELCSQQLGLIRYYKSLVQQYRDNLSITPELQNRLKWAYGFTNALNDQDTIRLTNRSSPIGDYRVQIQYRYTIPASIGSKVTTLHGGKGIIVGIREDSEMPQWDDGTIADLVMEGNSVNKRMNMGSLYEVATNAVGVQIHHTVSAMYEEGKYEEAYAHLVEFYSIVSPFYHLIVKALHTAKPMTKTGEPTWLYHLKCVVKDGIYLLIPPNTPGIGSKIIHNLEKRYGIKHQPARIPDGKGGYTYTKDDVLIGETYVVMLEKNGSDWSAVSSATRNHYGIISKRSQADKYSKPGHDNAIRITAEAEIRLFLVLLPDYIVSDILDRANNPHAHKAEIESILTAENVAQIENCVDRNKVPLGTGNRAINYILHILYCAGIDITSFGRKKK